MCLSLCLNELELREVSLLQPDQPSHAGARYVKICSSDCKSEYSSVFEHLNNLKLQ